MSGGEWRRLRERRRSGKGVYKDEADKGEPRGGRSEGGEGVKGNKG